MRVISIFNIIKLSHRLNTRDLKKIQLWEERFNNKYKDKILTIEEINYIKIKLKESLPIEKHESIENAIKNSLKTSDEIIKISLEKENALLYEIIGSTPVNHEEVSHPSKLLGIFTNDEGKNYSVIKPLRTTNNHGEKLFENVKIGQRIPKAQIDAFENEYPKEFNKLKECQMVIARDDFYLRGIGSFIYG